MNRLRPRQFGRGLEYQDSRALLACNMILSPKDFEHRGKRGES